MQRISLSCVNSLKMVSCLNLSMQLPSNHLRRPRLRREPPSLPLIHCALTKQAHRFLTSLSTTAAVTDDPSVSDRIIRKFVHSSSKSIALNALSHLLSPNTSHSHLSSLALPLYLGISEAAWFNWNPKIVADLVALLDKQGQDAKAQTLVADAISKLSCRERDLTLFYCSLVDSHSKRKSKLAFSNFYTLLKELIRASSSVYVKRRAYESMIDGLCTMDLPIEAEKLMEEMIGIQLKPSVFEYRCLIYAYGRLGLFNDMKRCVVRMEEEGFGLDTVSSNMVISSFGAHGELSEMALWLQKMKNSGIEYSVRTYNSVLNSCPTIITMLQDFQMIPISIQELTESLCEVEGLLVQELTESSVLEKAMEWNSMEGKLDLHGMHLGSAYLVLLQWREEMKSRFEDGNCKIPTEITVICGFGKHSTIRGESPVKNLVKQMIVRMNCPMRIDRKNVGCFVAKGRVLKDWLR